MTQRMLANTLCASKKRLVCALERLLDQNAKDIEIGLQRHADLVAESNVWRT